jgi:hypothetical protein
MKVVTLRRRRGDKERRWILNIVLVDDGSICNNNRQ